MGIPSPPPPVKLFIGMLSGDPLLFDRCSSILSQDYGPVESRHAVTAWTFSHYYQQEMGERLYRTFICFERLLDPSVLPVVKHRTNQVESSLAVRKGNRSCRTVNLDPGYVTEAKVVLASTKDYAHRIYVGDGIYAETTLVYRKDARGFRALETTYPEFRTDACRAWFNGVRDVLHAALRSASMRNDL